MLQLHLSDRQFYCLLIASYIRYFTVSIFPHWRATTKTHVNSIIWMIPSQIICWMWQNSGCVKLVYSKILWGACSAFIWSDITFDVCSLFYVPREEVLVSKWCLFPMLQSWTPSNVISQEDTSAKYIKVHFREHSFHHNYCHQTAMQYTTQVFSIGYIAFAN